MSRRVVATILVLVAAVALWLLLHEAQSPPGATSSPEGERNERPFKEAPESEADASASTPTLEGTGQAAPHDIKRPPLRGRVVDASTGAGIEGVRLLCGHERRGREEPGAALEALSDGNGNFAVDGLEPGTWIIIPFHKDYLHSFVGGLFADTLPSRDDMWTEARAGGLVFEFAEGARPPEDLEIRLKQGPRVRGRVLGPGDAGVAQAAVRAQLAYYGPLTELGVPGIQGAFRGLILTHADDAGAFSLACFPPALESIRLVAESDGLLGPWSDPLDLSNATTDVVLRLYEPATIEGVVLQEGGRPLAEALVFADSEWPADRVQATTDPEGRFRLEGLPPASVGLIARRQEEHKSAARLAIEGLRPGEVRTGIEIVLKDQRLVGGVLQSPDGTPLAREYVAASPTDEGEDPDDWLDGDWTDEAGRFLFKIESRSAFDIRIVSGNREDVLARNVHAPRRGLVLVTTPTPTATLQVRVTDPSGKPVPSFQLEGWPGGNGGWQDGEGKDGKASFSVQGSPPYRFLISGPRNAKGEELPLAPYGWEITEVPAEPVEIRLSPHAEFYGRILDLEDQPVAGMRLVIDEGSGEREIPVGEDGRFRFKAADPETREISEGRLILPEGYRDWTYVTILRAGDYEDIRVRGGGLPIKGRVILEGGGEASLDALGLQLSWTSSENNEDDDGRDIRTDAQGNFVLYALPDDAQVTVNVHPYSLAKRGLIAVSPPAVVPAGTTDIVLKVRIGATISGRVEGPGVADLDYTKLRACILPWHGVVNRFFEQTPPSSKSSAFRIAGLTPGSYRVALIDRQGPDRLLAWVDGVEAGRQDVVLRLPRLAGAVQGQVMLKGLKDVQEIEVGVWHQDGSNYLVVSEASADGTFKVERLDPEGRYAIQTAVHADGELLVATRSNVKPGQTIYLEPKPALSIRGQVEGHEAGKEVVAVMATAGGVPYFADFDAENGTFVFQGLADAEYDLTPLGPGLVRLATRRGVKAGSVDVTLRAK